MSLHTKIITLIMTITLSVGLGASLLLSHIMHNALTNELREQAVFAARGLTEHLTNNVINGEIIEAREAGLRMVANSPNIRYAYLIDFERRLFTHTFEGGFPKAFLAVEHQHAPLSAQFPKIIHLKTNIGAVLEVCYPLIEGMAAHIHIGMDEERTHVQIATLRYHIIGWTLLLTLVGITIGIVISRRMTRPWTDMINAMHDFGEGKTGKALEIHQGGKEITALKHAFNQMISARRRAEKKLKSSEEQLAQAQEIAHLGSWELDLVNNKIHWSDEVYRIFEIDPKAFDGSYKACIEALHPDDREFVDKAFTDSVRDMIPFDIEHRLLMQDGRIKYVYERGQTTYDDTGKPLQTLGIILDITERRQTEDKIRWAKKEWEKCFDASTDVIMLLDRQMRVVRVNQAACDLLEATNHQDLLGNFCYKLFCKASGPCPGCPVSACLADGKPHTTEDVHRSIGKIFLSTAAPLIDDQGKLYGAVLFAKDITEQKSLEGHVRQTQKAEAIGTLAGGIAHDFNNILTAILGYANIVRDSLAEGSQEWADQGEVLKAGKRATNLVKQILAFSRHAKHDVMPMAVQPIIKEALKLLRATIPTTIEIRQDIASDCCHIMADPTQIHQILMNLCTNAYHAMRDKGGVLSVLLQEIKIAPGGHLTEPDLPPGSYLRLEVSDTGHGIDRDVIEKIFEPYFTTSEQGEGTGLGLATVHGIVTNYGGEIRVTSEPGQGTTFDVYLPCLESEAVPQVEELAEPVLGGSERILCVDDEDSVVQIQKRVLKRLGYQVTACNSSTEALQTFKDQPEDIDLVITDMNMPEMNGMELSSAILATKANQPIILCSGFNDLITQDKLDSIGIQGFFMKPSSTKELAAIIRKVLDRE